MQTDIIGVSIGLLGIVIGVVVAYYFYRKSIRIKEPVYSILNNNLISDYTSQYQNLKISYNRKKVENLSVSKVLFYNRGSETITQPDIDTINHLRVSVKKGLKILDASILQMNNPSSLFTIDLDYEKNKVFINFDYLDKNQGAVFQVIHTGLSPEDIDLFGDIKGANKLTLLAPRQYGKITQMFLKILRHEKAEKLIGLLVMLSFFGFLSMTIGSILSPQLKELMRTPLPVIVPIFASLIMIPFIFIAIDMTFRDRSNRIAPNGLEKFDK